jgi:hypothetical protein
MNFEPLKSGILLTSFTTQNTTTSPPNHHVWNPKIAKIPYFHHNRYTTKKRAFHEPKSPPELQL